MARCINVDSSGDNSVMQAGEGPVSIPLATHTRGISLLFNLREHELHTVFQPDHLEPYFHHV